jgi:hypothetical protein
MSGNTFECPFREEHLQERLERLGGRKACRLGGRTRLAVFSTSLGRLGAQTTALSAAGRWTVAMLLQTAPAVPGQASPPRASRRTGASCSARYRSAHPQQPGQLGVRDGRVTTRQVRQRRSRLMATPAAAELRRLDPVGSADDLADLPQSTAHISRASRRISRGRSGRTRPRSPRRGFGRCRERRQPGNGQYPTFIGSR